MNKCSYEGCIKKLTLTTFACKCSFKFCDKHRIPEDHNCSYNYKNNYSKQLEVSNKTVIANKLSDRI
jgi:predicted nucleic acid binding AN1-type Zn finger protein